MCLRVIYSLFYDIIMMNINASNFSQLIVLQHEGYAGILKGPAATGKSESIKELSKILGFYLICLFERAGSFKF